MFEWCVALTGAFQQGHRLPLIFIVHCFEYKHLINQCEPVIYSCSVFRFEMGGSPCGSETVWGGVIILGSDTTTLQAPRWAVSGPASVAFCWYRLEPEAHRAAGLHSSSSLHHLWSLFRWGIPLPAAPGVNQSPMDFVWFWHLNRSRPFLTQRPDSKNKLTLDFTHLIQRDLYDFVRFYSSVKCELGRFECSEILYIPYEAATWLESGSICKDILRLYPQKCSVQCFDGRAPVPCVFWYLLELMRFNT